jgi:hypothetical protein
MMEERYRVNGTALEASVTSEFNELLCHDENRVGVIHYA